MLNKLFKWTITIVITIIQVSQINAQNIDSMAILLKERMELRREGKDFRGVGAFRKHLKESPKELALKVQEYLSDESDKVRSFAYNLISVIGQHSKDSKYRMSIVDIIAKGCNDKEAYLRTNNIKSLDNYQLSEFSPSAKKAIKELLHMDRDRAERVYLMVGFLDFKDERPFMNQLLEKYNPERKRDIRNLRMALARLGDQKQIDYLINWVKNSGRDYRNDEFLFPCLAYTKDKKAFDYIFEEINTANKSIGAKLIELVAPTIVNFPIKLEDGDDIDYEEWEQALKTTKDWYQKNKDNYVIQKETYGFWY